MCITVYLFLWEQTIYWNTFKHLENLNLFSPLKFIFFPMNAAYSTNSANICWINEWILVLYLKWQSDRRYKSKYLNKYTGHRVLSGSTNKSKKCC
jgi:hypothetical protein